MGLSRTGSFQSIFTSSHKATISNVVVFLQADHTFHQTFMKKKSTISDVHPARSRAIARTERHNNRHDLLAVEYYQLLAILPSRSTSIDTLTRFTTRPSVSALLSRLSYRYPAQGCAVRAGARSASSPTQLLSLAWYTHTLCARLGARAGH